MLKISRKNRENVAFWTPTRRNKLVNSNEIVEKLSEIYFPCQIARKQIYLEILSI